MCTFLSWSTFLPVGYDSEHMNLSGRYSYHRLAHIFKCKSVVDYQIKIWDPGKTFQIKICNPGKTNVRCPSMWTSRTCLHIRESLLEVQVGFMISRYCWWSCIVHPGNYSAYGFEILLSRSLGPFILSVYLPSAMFVMMSWVSFFVPPVSISIILHISLSLHNNCILWLHRYKSPTKKWTCCEYKSQSGTFLYWYFHNHSSSTIPPELLLEEVLIKWFWEK